LKSIYIAVDNDNYKWDVFHQQNVRKIIGVTWKDKVTNTDVLKWTGQRRLQDIIGERRFRFVAQECPAHSAIDWIPVDGRKRRGRPRKIWRLTFCDDLHARGVRRSEVEEVAADHVRWQNLLPIVLRTDGR